MMNFNNELLQSIRYEFSDSFINNRNELILIPKTNLYFSLKDIENEIDLKCKLLEWCSRDAFKSQPFNQQWRNNRYNKQVAESINTILETEFDEDDFEDIYIKLGNGINRKLCIDFIESNYDFKLLGR